VYLQFYCLYVGTIVNFTPYKDRLQVSAGGKGDPPAGGGDKRGAHRGGGAHRDNGTGISGGNHG